MKKISSKEFVKKLKVLSKTKKGYAKAVKKAVKKPQDENYWRARQKDDKERDWGYGKDNWVEDYSASVDHPHRATIVELLKTFEWAYLLEVGCSSGPNLKLIRDAFPDKALFGMDVNADSVMEAKKFLPDNVAVRQGAVNHIHFIDGYFDVVLADAVLMYTTPEDIERAMKEIDRVAKRAVLIVDRFAENEEITGHVWGRNYTRILEDMGYSVMEVPMTEELWPTSKNWQKYGRYFLALK